MRRYRISFAAVPVTAETLAAPSRAEDEQDAVFNGIAFSELHDELWPSDVPEPSEIEAKA